MFATETELEGHNNGDQEDMEMLDGMEANAQRFVGGERRLMVRLSEGVLPFGYRLGVKKLKVKTHHACPSKRTINSNATWSSGVRKGKPTSLEL